jgi:hypothetical protein
MVFALTHGLTGGHNPELAGAATGLALGSIGLVGAGAALRWCGSCCGDDCCDWDERPNATLTTGTPHTH